MATTPILLVDDDEHIREMYSTALELAGLQVLTATTVREAVRTALRKQPAVILMDINLGKDDTGHDAVKQIRQDAWGATVPIIYLTNRVEPAEITEAYEHHPDDYIIKGHADVKEVVNKVRLAMHQHDT